MSDRTNEINRNQWQFWIDRGGTFTDIIAKNPNGEIESLKLLSEGSLSTYDPIEEAINYFFKKYPNFKSNKKDIEIIKVGTTIGTNALLERKGSKTALVITKGFADILKIGYQNRPDLFSLDIKLPDPLYEKVIEIDERILSDGKVIKKLNIQKIRSDLIKAYDEGFKSLAIIFMHSYKYNQHERSIEKIAQNIGFKQISCSHNVSPTIKIINRGDTSVLDAYISPTIKKYSLNLEKKFRNTKLLFMQSNGGLSNSKNFKGKNSILSGPAGGVIGAILSSQKAGINKIIGFDMGGTSTDVCHYNGKIERTFSTEIAGVKMQTPMIAVNTVAAGGGSILNFDGSRFRVGPESAGANPGPACYGKGGPLTITDANLIVGKLQKEFFPTIFGPDSNQPINFNIVKEKFRELSIKINKSISKKMSIEEIAYGFIKIAVENMANTIKKISIEKGYDVKDYNLCCFGGAGGQHACMVAESLGINKIFIHPFSGVLSALGIGLSDLTVVKEKTVELLLDYENEEIINKEIEALSKKGLTELVSKDAEGSSISSIISFNLKYSGTDSTIDIPYTTINEVEKKFELEHLKIFGFSSPQKQIIIESIIIELVAQNKSKSQNFFESKINSEKSKKNKYKKIYMNKDWHEIELI